jgi:hypothetical protein
MRATRRRRNTDKAARGSGATIDAAVKPAAALSMNNQASTAAIAQTKAFMRHMTSGATNKKISLRLARASRV